MDKKIALRVIEEADELLNSKTTIRELAKKFSVSKSTTHKDLKERLLEIDINKYKEIQEIFDEHILIRHIRGGQSTKEKYLRQKNL